VTVSDALYDWRGWSIKITDANGWSPLIVLFPTGGAYRTAVRQVEDAIAFLVIPRAVTAKHRRS
jgi:hypothetical protein